MKINQINNYEINKQPMNTSFASLKNLKERWYGKDYLENNPHPKSLFKNNEETIEDILSDEPCLSSSIKHKWNKFLEEKAMNVGGTCLILSAILACGFALTKSCNKKLTDSSVKDSINYVKELPSSKILKNQ